MKKIIPLLLISLLLTSCGNLVETTSSSSSSNPITSDPYTNNAPIDEFYLDDIKNTFNSTYKTSEDYDFEIIETDTLNISLVKIYNPLLEKKLTAMELGKRLIEIEATSEFSKLDLFLYSDGYIIELEKLFQNEEQSESTYSLINNISTENPNYIEVEEKNIETDRIKNVQNYLSNENLFSMDITEMDKSKIREDFGLTTNDYVGALYHTSNLYSDSNFAAFEYETDEQKNGIIEGIENYKNKLISQFLFKKMELSEEDKDNLEIQKYIDEYNSQAKVSYNGNLYIDNEEFKSIKDSIENILVISDMGLVVMVHELNSSSYEPFVKNLISMSMNPIENLAKIQEELLIADKKFMEEMNKNKDVEEEAHSETENTED